MSYGASATGGPPQGSGISFFAAGGWATRREPNMRQDPVRQKPSLYFSQARQKVDRNARLLGESGPGRELASHQCTHLGRRGRARIATHALELAFHVGN